jgi:hypothetical protein
MPGGRWRALLGSLFPADARPPASRRAVIVAGIAVVVGAVVSLGRVGSPGPFNTVWAEDGTDFLTDALNRNPLRSLFRPLSGYFVMFPRLLAFPVRLVPPEWGPTVLSVEAALVTAAMAVIVYVASGAHFRELASGTGRLSRELASGTGRLSRELASGTGRLSRGSVLARAVAAVPVVVVPVGENVYATLANNVATLQFAATYTLLWVLLWVPSTRGGRTTAVLVTLAVASSTILAAVLIPLALLRLYLRRDRVSLVMVGGLLLGAAANATALAVHLTRRPAISVPHYDPLWALDYTPWALRNAMFGYRGANGIGAEHVGVLGTTVAAGLVLAAIVLVAAFRVTRPSWLLAGVMVGHALVFWCLTLMAHGWVEMRYAAGPELMLFAAMASLLLPAPSRRWAHLPLAALAAFVAIICVLSYQSPSQRTATTPWRALVAQARAVCANPRYGAVDVYPSWEGKVKPILAGTPLPTKLPAHGFPVRLPCDRLGGG